MTEDQINTCDNLLKIPHIYKTSSPVLHLLDQVYLDVIGKNHKRYYIKVHESGDFSFVKRFGPRMSKYRYKKNVDMIIAGLFPETVSGLAYHLDLLYKG